MLNLTLPTVHLNGTSRGVLLESHQDALAAVLRAQDALRQACPNARDYPTPEAASRAQDEHYSRVGRLQSVKDELQEILIHVAGVTLR